MSQGTQFLDGVLQALAQLVEDFQRALGVRLGQPPGQADIDGQRHQVLLGAVVEVALDLATSGVRSGDDARPGLLELLGLEAEVLQRLLQGGVELHVVQGEADLAGQFGQHHVVVGGELVASRRAHSHDEPEHPARVSGRGDPQQGALPADDHARHPYAQPGRAGDAGPGHDGFLLGAQYEVGDGDVGNRDRTRQVAARTGPNLGRAQGQGLAQGLGHLEEQLVHGYGARQPAAEGAQHGVGRLPLAVDETVGIEGQPLAGRAVENGGHGGRDHRQDEQGPFAAARECCPARPPPPGRPPPPRR